MNLKEDYSVALSKLSSLLDNVSCYECCKNYIAPETAQCGHSLCHICWGQRRKCPLCTLPVDRKLVKLNLPLQKWTEHVQVLAVTFEHLLNVKLDKLDVVEPKDDPAKNVTEWLASSQNHFSAPAHSSELSSQELKCNSNQVEVSSSKIQIHTITKKRMSPENVIHVSTPQDDWDKIETMPNEEIVQCPPCNVDDDNEYSTNNPRRSSRKREFKNNDSNLNTKNNISLKQQIEASAEVEKKLPNSKQKWNNVKKMRKEFSKLNKINRNKLNVSIEMCKKNENTVKTNVSLQKSDTPQPQVYEIDENTPTYFNTKSTTNVVDIVMAQVTPSSHTNDKTTNSNQTGIEPLLRNESKILSNENLRDVCNEKTEKSQVNSSLTTTKQGRMPFYKRSALCNTSENVYVEPNATKMFNNIQETNSNSNDDIEISIKVGNKITNIVIRKNNEVQFKVTADREVQTSLSPLQNDSGNISSQTIETRNCIAINIDSNSDVNLEHKKSKEELKKTVISSLKSASLKKNTSSADTGSAQFEITESVEKELSNIMECTEIKDQNKTESVNSVPKNISQIIQTPIPQIASSQISKTQKSGPGKSQKIGSHVDMQEDIIDYLNVMDIFESDNVTETPVQILENVKGTPSEILIPTARNKNKTQKSTEKRNREINDEELPTSKKQKCNNDNTEVDKSLTKHNRHQPDSEPLNYDSIMGKVFASIDADMEEIKTQSDLKKIADNNASNTDKVTLNVNHKQSATFEKNAIDGSTPYKNDLDNQKESENIFSVCLEKDDVIEASLGLEKVKESLAEHQPNIEDFLTPVRSRNQKSESEAPINTNVIEIVNDDSESVVIEDTPQKNASFGKSKHKNIGLDSSQRISARGSSVTGGNAVDLESSNTVVNLVDQSAEMKSTKDNNITVVETVARNSKLETPLNINKFVDQIQHNSTPVARKSLSFQNDNFDDIDPEQTLCPTNAVTDTTQEKEFMRKAFETTPTTQIVKPLSRVRCIAGSCLSVGELAKLKLLCSMHKWIYVDKYTKDLTHLVVGVDEENKAQRSVKFMCALAASKWIVSFEWVEKCLRTKKIVSEDIYEALDSTGEPGPRRSRVANKRLFQGITFFCMEPFNMLEVNTLKEMLESSGARVVSDVKEVKVTDKTPGPAILLAEPENTQEDRFFYVAMQLSIVPVNYEWVLNCLGCYTLVSIQELLLCPFALLPKITASWPQHLIARENDEN